MDRNTFIGIALIIAIFGTFTYLNRDTPEQIQAKKTLPAETKTLDHRQPGQLGCRHTVHQGTISSSAYPGVQ